METGKLKKFAQEARKSLLDQVSAKLTLVLASGSAARRESPSAVKELEQLVNERGQDHVVEKVAYTWFNRFSALRFMDANGYNTMRAITPAEGQTRPEILAEAAAGQIDDTMPLPTRNTIAALLDGRTPSGDAQGEAYRLLLVATCNQWHAAMPFLFEKIADYTELLMPEDLLSQDSILAQMRAVMTDADCVDVEIIGWLYQFYISEKKDQVFAGLKKNIKITAENIPAATQLFTPHWIVRYLVENSLGRLWMLNRPGSSLHKQMDYYIAPEEAETDFLRIGKPEEIKLCDPACGSGHMLTYAFDLLYAIYEEEGYDPATIPDLILTHNLYGVEIDDRAGALAAFALVMKAAGRRRRFLRAPVQPNICVMQDMSFTDRELADYTAAVGRDLFTSDLRETLGQFDQAKNFGALIVPKLGVVAEVARRVAALNFESNLFLRDVHARVGQVLRMAEALSPKYHVVVANPPYMGSGGMNGKLGDFARNFYPNSKSDLFAMFIERALALLLTRGMAAMINMQSWMFLSSFEKLRAQVLSNASLLTMAHIGERGFDSIGGAVVSTTAFVLMKSRTVSHTGEYLRLVDGGSESEKCLTAKRAILERSGPSFYRTNDDSLKRIPGSPIAYWLSEAILRLFVETSFGTEFDSKEGVGTRNDEVFMRLQWEVSRGRVSRDSRWIQSDKAGDSRRWYLGFNYLMDWENDGKRIKEYRNDDGSLRSRPQNLQYMFLEGVTWAKVSAGAQAFRWRPSGYGFNDAAPTLFGQEPFRALAQLNSIVMRPLLSATGNTINISTGTIGALPFLKISNDNTSLSGNSASLVADARADWDAFETSWDFSTLPLLDPAHRQASMAATYATLRAHWQGMTTQMQALEEQNNRIFIDAYGLAEELTPQVPLEEITLTCNPAYRYGGKKTVAELEALLQADTVAEFLHYAVGCMFGRYSLDAPGLIMANQGDGIEQYLAKVPAPTFEADADNVIPMLDQDWFGDDITERFRKFLRVTFGDERFVENLGFIEEALGKDIRKYFTKDFYNDHVKRYKKRPIYWLFTSPKGNFNALIYMHRYRPDTVSVVLNDYLREYRNKLEAHRKQLEAQSISSAASPAQKTKALKDIESTGKVIEDLHAYERDILYPLATQKIEIDLDDGVKVNYPKLGAALKPIKGLADAED